ncbi:acyl-CoA N-acyltransferase [Hyaloscypha variabilis F]|uniref:Acyl-CoA N-acyltransferase n=1 Tax=Hyaloscypha variabilis (strain UAMH 11265 / GT02V1 / F) TaxID=1149755 RepID=A0A2J6R0X1_HYAVF|nr:acyl-CoA N-acyltransferase [Hyaloscypha variabilis F]
MVDHNMRSSRLDLQPLSLAHLQDFHAIMTDAVGLRFSTRKPFLSIEATKSLLEKWIYSPEKPWLDNHAILLRSSGNEGEESRMIGTVGVVRLPGDAFFDSAEIAYGIHSDFWGKGYASEALGMFVGLYWTAGRDGVDVKNSLVASIDPENKASERVVQKAGFRKREKMKDGYVRGGEGGEVSEQVWWVLERP